MIVTCDKCKKDFYNMLNEKEKEVDGLTVIMTFLRCSHCGEIYPACFDTAETISVKKQIRKQTSELQETHNPKKYEKKLANIKKKQKWLLSKSNHLETKYLKEFMEDLKNGREH